MIIKCDFTKEYICEYSCHETDSEEMRKKIWEK